jgi:hypothetical protein
MQVIYRLARRTHLQIIHSSSSSSCNYICRTRRRYDKTGVSVRIIDFDKGLEPFLNTQTPFQDSFLPPLLSFFASLGNQGFWCQMGERAGMMGGRGGSRRSRREGRKAAVQERRRKVEHLGSARGWNNCGYFD